jgi:hypothetical protein
MCEVTEGYSKGCDSVGGSRKAYLFAVKDSTGASNYATPPTIVDGAVTAISLKAGKFAYAYDVEPETIDASTNSVGSSANGSDAYEHSTTLSLHGNSAEMIAEARRLCKGRVAVILEMNDGTYELYHYEHGGKVQRNRATGKALEDMNGSTLAITSKQVGTEVKISSLLVNGLLD